MLKTGLRQRWYVVVVRHGSGSMAGEAGQPEEAEAQPYSRVEDGGDEVEGGAEDGQGCGSLLRVREREVREGGAGGVRVEG